MKRPLFVFVALITGMFVFSSCNKNLKDDIKELRNMLGADEPITVTTSFKDYANVDQSITETYKFKSIGAYSQALIKLPDGKYGVRIARFSDVQGLEQVWVFFVYNPTTKEITNKEGGHNWESYGNYDSRVDYDGNNNIAGLTFNINIKNFNLTTGEISLDVEMAGTAEWASQANQVPNSDAAVSTKFSFAGVLKNFEISNQPL